MLLTNRFGVTASSSSRVQVTAAAGSASTFFVTKTRPVVVAAQPVDVSAFVRSIATTAGPARLPQAALVSGTAPSGAQSPQAAESPVDLLQTACASRVGARAEASGLRPVGREAGAEEQRLR